MKKNILFTILAVLSVLILASCSKKTTTTTAKPTTTLDSFWDSNGNGTADWQESEVNLTYATWQYATDQTTIDSVLIDQFMAKYPNVHITIKDLGAYDGDTWDTALQALAETGDLPDVMLVNRLETTVPYNMLANITDYYDHDADSANIFASLQTSGVYDGIRYAVPSFVYAKWWFVNLDILANAGISAPSYDWTWDQMEAIAKACYNETTNTVGQSGYTQYWMELPKVLKQNSSWAAFTYNTADSSWNFGDSAFEQAMDKLSAALQSNACTSPYGVDEIQQKYGITVTDYALSNGYNIGFDGHAAIWTSPSWVAKDYFSKMNFNWDVYPCPGGTVGGNTDLIGISSTCNNVAAAYQLLKFMSYGEDGVIQRFSDYKQYGSSL